MPHRNDTPHPRGERHAHEPRHGGPVRKERAPAPEDRPRENPHVRQRRARQIVATFDALAERAAAMGPGAEVEVVHRVRADGTAYHVRSGPPS